MFFAEFLFLHFIFVAFTNDKFIPILLYLKVGHHPMPELPETPPRRAQTNMTNVICLFNMDNGDHLNALLLLPPNGPQLSKT